VVLFSTDLMLLSSVSGAAQSLGFSFRSARTMSEAAQLLRTDGTVLCVDLSLGVDPGELAGACSGLVLQRAIAFGPHVHTAKLEAAKSAGFGVVISRGRFVMQLQSLLAART
jgi:hypothetical protein